MSWGYLKKKTQKAKFWKAAFVQDNLLERGPGRKARHTV